MIILDIIKQRNKIIPNVGKTFKKLLREATNIRIVCPFFSENRNFPTSNLFKDKKIQIICNLDHPGCNPKTIQKIFRAGSSNNQPDAIRYNNLIHAKVYIFDDKIALITSANCTPNGIGDGAIESAIILEDSQEINTLNKWFESLWEKSHGITNVNWDKLIAKWNLKRDINKSIKKSQLYKPNIEYLIKSETNNENLGFVFWEDQDDGYEIIKQQISKKDKIEISTFECITDLFDNNKEKERLAKLYKSLKNQYLFVFKYSKNKVFKTYQENGYVFGYEFRKGNKITTKQDCDSIVLKYHTLSPANFPFKVPNSFVTKLNQVIKNHHQEWENLLERNFGYCTTKELESFL